LQILTYFLQIFANIIFSMGEIPITIADYLTIRGVTDPTKRAELADTLNSLHAVITDSSGSDTPQTADKSTRIAQTPINQVSNVPLRLRRNQQTHVEQPLPASSARRPNYWERRVGSAPVRRVTSRARPFTPRPASQGISSELIGLASVCGLVSIGATAVIIYEIAHQQDNPATFQTTSPQSITYDNVGTQGQPAGWEIWMNDRLSGLNWFNGQ
jgi:hypothetical protein